MIDSLLESNAEYQELEKESKKQGDAGTEHKKTKVFRNQAVVFEIEKNPDVKQTGNDEGAHPFFFIAHLDGVNQLQALHQKNGNTRKQNGRGEQ